MQDRIVIGDTLNFPTTVPDYLASDGWTLHYRLIQRSTGTAIDLTAITDPDNADGYAVQESAVTTAGWTAGDYSWASWVAKGAEVYSLGNGTCTLLPNPRTAVAGYDVRSDARRALDDARAAYYTMAASPGTKFYMIAGRQMMFRETGDLLKLIAHLEAQVVAEDRAERISKGYPDPRKVYVRMSGA